MENECEEIRNKYESMQRDGRYLLDIIVNTGIGIVSGLCFTIYFLYTNCEEVKLLKNASNIYIEKCEKNPKDGLNYLQNTLNSIVEKNNNKIEKHESNDSALIEKIVKLEDQVSEVSKSIRDDIPKILYKPAIKEISKSVENIVDDYDIFLGFGGIFSLLCLARYASCLDKY